MKKRIPSLLKTITVTAAVTTAPLVWAGTAKSGTAPSESKSAAPRTAAESSLPESSASSDRLDIGNLEQKYWAAKDDDFTVVQNRSYTKENKMSIGFMSGTIINDGFIQGTPSAVSLGYFFNERHGLSLDFTQFATQQNSTIRLFRHDHGTSPDFNYPVSTTSVTYMWSPIYAKVSLLEKKILYLDLMLGAHVGVSNYKSENFNGDIPGQTTHYGFDVSQVWFINRYTAFRFDIRSSWSKQKKYDVYSTSSTSYEDSATLQDNLWLFGVNFYFGWDRANSKLNSNPQG